MDRRDFLGGLLTIPALSGVECEAQVAVVPSDARPKTWTFQAHLAHTSAETEALSPGEARQFLADAIRDMATVLGQGRVHPAVPEPAWLTASVDEAIREALREEHAIRIRWLQSELAHAEAAFKSS